MGITISTPVVSHMTRPAGQTIEVAVDLSSSENFGGCSIGFFFTAPDAYNFGKNEPVDLTDQTNLHIVSSIIIPTDAELVDYILEITVRRNSDWALLPHNQTKLIVTAAEAPAPVPLLTLDSTYSLVFNDDFSGDWNLNWVDHEPWENPPGRQPISTTWQPIPAGDMVEVISGILNMHNRIRINPVNAAMVTSEISTRGKYQSFVHGYIEGRFKIGGHSQAFPAFWLLGNGTWPATGEIDIFEFVNNGNANEVGKPFFTAHWSGPGGHIQKTFEWPAAVPNFTTEFHTWGLQRTPNSLAVYVDGVQWGQITESQLVALGGNYSVIFNEPMHIRLSHQSAGNLPGYWSYNPNVPAQAGVLQVDHIRSWHKNL